MEHHILLGIDGGGTYVRAAITDLKGNLLSYVKWNGGAYLHKDANANEHVRGAVMLALEKANRRLSDIAGAVAGIAGYDSERDMEWVRELTNFGGLNAVTQHVNDAVIAHRGALRSRPGIIAISGTGSVIYGITEAGRHIRNYDYGHYAATAARCLSYNSVYRVIAGEIDQTDSDFVEHVLKYFHVQDPAALTKLGAVGFQADAAERNKLFGDMAPLVTKAALKGSRMAADVCRQAAAELTTGIRMIGASFEADTVSVALIGSVANSPAIKTALQSNFTIGRPKNFRIVDSYLPAVLGAVVMAMQLKAIDLNEEIDSNLRAGAGQIAQQA